MLQLACAREIALLFISRYVYVCVQCHTYTKSGTKVHHLFFSAKNFPDYFSSFFKNTVRNEFVALPSTHHTRLSNTRMNNLHEIIVFPSLLNGDGNYSYS